MPFNRPTLAELIERASADIESRLPGTDPRLRRANVQVLARMHAGALHGLYGYLDWIARQILPDTSDAEILQRQADIWSITRKPAAAAKGNVGFTGTDASVIPAATVLQRSDGVRFTTDAEGTIAAGVATVAVTAEEGGAAGDTAASSTLTLVSPVSGIDSAATVAAGGLTGGVDIESDDDLRARLLLRLQQPPQGGAEQDYIAWALEVAGVSRVWVYPEELGPGTVTVRFMRDDDTGSAIPDAAEVLAVQDYIDARRPVTADVHVLAPVAVPLDFTIAVTPNTQAVKDAVAAELADLLLRDAEPGGTIRLSRLHEAISLAEAEEDHVLTSPAADVTHTTGQLATLGTITWV